MSSTILGGIRVLDFTRGLSGPFATQILGDLGADVIKVEPPTGDDQRSDKSASKSGDTPPAFVAYNRNKRNIVLNLKAEDGLRAAQALARRSDVLFHNYRTGVMEKYDLGYEAVAAHNPSVVYCSISGFGSSGPRSQKAANDIVVQAASGLMSITGAPDMPPVRCHGYPADVTSGVWAALGTIAAIHHRSNTGEGQHVQVSMMDTVMASLGRVYGRYLQDGFVPERLGSGTDMGVPNGAFPAKDGWVAIVGLNDRPWTRVCQALGLEHLVGDPRFATREDRRQNGAEVTELLSAATSKLTRAEATAALEAEGASFSAISTVPEVAEDPSTQHLFIDVPLANGKTARTVGSPLQFSLTKTAVRRGIAEPGEHNDEVLRELEEAGDLDADASLAEPR